MSGNQYRMKRKHLGFYCVVERAGAVYVMSGRARSENDVTVELVYATFWDFRGGKDVTRPLRGVEFEIAAKWLEARVAECATLEMKTVEDDRFFE